MFPARFLPVAGAALLLAGCSQPLPQGSARGQVPIPPSTLSLMSVKGMQPSDPILIRAYKKESEMEVWKRGTNGRYALLKTYPICRWSGQLGPKVTQGDRQAPEGFYAVSPAQMNPNSAYYLSFDTGFPNAYDRSQGRSGSALMVHGNCSSAGCYAMTDEAIAEIYAMARESLAGGQRAFQFQAYPFRMTAENMAKYREDRNFAFWRNLKEGSDRFEATGEEPQVAVATGRYRFQISPEGEAVAARKIAQDEHRYAALVGSTPAIRTAYADGASHPSFQGMLSGERLDVSRPEALASAGQDVPVSASTPLVWVAEARAKAAGRLPLAEAQGNAELTARSRPAPGRGPQPAPTQVASARIASPPPAPVDERPFYSRWLGNLFRS
ncbi:MAG TPA: L,D-transpeptidase family protein [Microvirga sp.]|nr:L,D-transpeptidase family protein [Microvirga sp.]